MQATVRVLIEVEADALASSLAVLRFTSGHVTESYDSRFLIERSDNREIGQIVMQTIHTLTAIKRTDTCRTIGCTLGDGRNTAPSLISFRRFRRYGGF